VVEFRGNLQTRLMKLEQGVAEATFLAMAGLNRLGMDEVPKTAIEVETMLPAVAQGAIGIERRVDDMRMAEMLEAIHDKPTGQRLAAERAFLAALDGSCETPIAGLADLDGTEIHLRGEVLRPDGSEAIDDALRCPVEDGAEAGREMAQKLLAQAGEGFFDWRS
jgi:hydroxymethylbilane synthase